MRQARILTRTIPFLAMVCLVLGISGISQPVSAQVTYQCPYGYYYVLNYGCAPLSYLDGYPYYGYPYYGFNFFYGDGWGRPGWGGYGYRGGPRGGGPRGGGPHGGGHAHGR